MEEKYPSKREKLLNNGFGSKNLDPDIVQVFSNIGQEDDNYQGVNAAKASDEQPRLRPISSRPHNQTTSVAEDLTLGLDIQFIISEQNLVSVFNVTEIYPNNIFFSSGATFSSLSAPFV